MIYVIERSFNRQIELFRCFEPVEDFELIIWMYPEVEMVNFLGFPLQSSELEKSEPVTTYSDGGYTRCSCRVPLTEELITMLSTKSKDISRSCDSLCLYPRDSNRWAVCTIGHEGMALVRDDSYFLELRSKLFEVSMEPPSGW